MQEDLDIDSGLGVGEGGGQLLLDTYLHPVTVFAAEPPPQAQESFLASSMSYGDSKLVTISCT
jgi:hypothetical protein